MEMPLKVATRWLAWRAYKIFLSLSMRAWMVPLTISLLSSFSSVWGWVEGGGER